MTRPAKANPTLTLSRSWSRWTGVVAGCALRRVTGGVTRASYAALYREVLDACEAARDAATEADRAFYEDLAGLAQPWVTLDVLVRTDREMLGQLLERCRSCERRLRGQKERRPRAWKVSQDAVFCIGLLVLMAAVTFALDWWPPWLTAHLERQGRAAWNAWRVLGTTNQALVMTAVVLLLGVALLGRLARKK